MVVLTEIEYTERFMRHAEDVAKDYDCTVLYSDEYTLQVDCDSPEDLEFLKEQLEILEGYEGEADFMYPNPRPVFQIQEVLPSKSGNTHVLLSSNQKLSVPERIMWQTLLGSDRRRELFNIMRHHKGCQDPIILFRPKE